jgi:DNA-binding IclR family transcriptional regulator
LKVRLDVRRETPQHDDGCLFRSQYNASAAQPPPWKICSTAERCRPPSWPALTGGPSAANADLGRIRARGTPSTRGGPRGCVAALGRALWNAEGPRWPGVLVSMPSVRYRPEDNIRVDAALRFAAAIASRLDR